MVTGDGTVMCFQVPCPNHVLIDRICVRQSVGTAVPFNVDVFTRGPACSGTAELSDDAGAEVEDDDLYKWCNQFTAASVNGKNQAEITFNPWRGYENKDKTFPNRSRVLQKYYIYIRITLTGSAGNYTFGLTISCSSDLQR